MSYDGTDVTLVVMYWSNRGVDEAGFNKRYYCWMSLGKTTIIPLVMLTNQIGGIS